MTTYRTKMQPLIASVIAEHKNEPLNAIREHLREAFPMGPRQYHPYKIWLSECRVQLLAACLPPGFNASDLKNRVAVSIMADWWEERGDVQRARLLRSHKPKRGPIRKGERRELPADERQRTLGL